MRAALTALFAVAATTLAAAPAAAQTAEDKADVRCILVLTVAAREAQNTAAAQQGTFYFVGRIDGNGMTGKLESLMLSESRGINSGAIVQSELTRCGDILNKRSLALQTMSQRLQAAVKSAAPAAK